MAIANSIARSTPPDSTSPMERAYRKNTAETLPASASTQAWPRRKGNRQRTSRDHDKTPRQSKSKGSTTAANSMYCPIQPVISADCTSAANAASALMPSSTRNITPKLRQSGKG